MTPERPRSAAEPKDRDKMIRQLSLVAYLMSAGGRKVDAATIRWNVEGYGDEEQSFDAFTRRFFADRDELKQIGIEIRSERDEFGDSDVYWLPREDFFLPQVRFTADELAALHTCLHLLGGQFAYSRLLRLALQGLALGSGNTLSDPATSHFSVNLLSPGYDSEVAGRLSRIETGISRRKTIVFEYHSMARDESEERRVDPYGLMVSRGDWYMVGYSHEREGIRVFKLGRIQGRIRNVSKKEHDFPAPADFDLKRYLKLEPWQLGPVRGTAEIRFNPTMGWWASNALSHCGTVDEQEDGTTVFTTEYSDPRELCSLVLGLGPSVELVSPDELRLQLAAALELVAGLHRQAPPELSPTVKKQQESSPNHARDAAPQVEPEHFSQLAKTVSYLMNRLEEAETAVLPIEAVCEDLGFDQATLEKDMELLRLVNTGGGGYLIEAYVDGDSLKVSAWPEGDILKQPVRLTPREAKAMILAIDLVGSQLLSGQFESLESAREKIFAAAGSPDDLKTIPVEGKDRDDVAVSSAINRGMDEGLVVEMEYLSREHGLTTRRIEPYLLNRTKSQWYLVAWCRERQALRTFRYEMIKSAGVTDEHFEPRDIDLEPFLEDPNLPSGTADARSADIWFSPGVSRWVREMQPHSTLLEDGSLRCEVPFFSDRWLTEEIIKYQGDAILLAPAESREKVADTAVELLGRYRS